MLMVAELESLEKLVSLASLDGTVQLLLALHMARSFRVSVSLGFCAAKCVLVSFLRRLSAAELSSKQCEHKVITTMVTRPLDDPT